MKLNLFLVFLVPSFVLGLSLSTMEIDSQGSDTGLPRSFNDLYHHSGLIIRGKIIDPDPQSDLIQITVTEVYKGSCTEVVSIRRLELQNLNPISADQDSIFFLKNLGVIYTLSCGTAGVYHIIDDQIYNNGEFSENSPFKVDGLDLQDFIQSLPE